MADVHSCGLSINSIIVRVIVCWKDVNAKPFRGDLSKLLFPNRPPQLFLLLHQLVMGFRWGCTDAQPGCKVGLCPGVEIPWRFGTPGRTLAFGVCIGKSIRAHR